MRDFELVAGTIIEEAISIHRALGPGLLESVYETLLAARLMRAGLAVGRQKSVSFQHDGLSFADAFRVDLLVEGQGVVEVKSTEGVAPVHIRQVLTYIRLLRVPVGQLVNFGDETLKEGLRRVLNDRIG